MFIILTSQFYLINLKSKSLTYTWNNNKKKKRSVQRTSSDDDVASFSNGEVGDIVWGLNGGIRIVDGGGGGGWSGDGVGVIIIFVVIRRIRSGDVDARKAFQGREESGRDGGPQPGCHRIQLLFRYQAAVVLHRGMVDAQSDLKSFFVVLRITTTTQTKNNKQPPKLPIAPLNTNYYTFPLTIISNHRVIKLVHSIPPDFITWILKFTVNCSNYV